MTKENSKALAHAMAAIRPVKTKLRDQWEKDCAALAQSLSSQDATFNQKKFLNGCYLGRHADCVPDFSK